MKTKEEQVRNAIWNLTSAESELKGKSEYNEISKEIIRIRDKLKAVLSGGSE